MCIRPIARQDLQASLNCTGEAFIIHKGLIMKPKLIEKLPTEIRISKSGNKYYSTDGIFMCPVCNLEYRASMQSVKNNKSTKCRICANRKSSTIHGKHNSKIYKVFYGIKNRCYSKNNTNYKDYGGRGVTICDEWMNNPLSFVEWALNNGYKDGLEIDKDIKSEELGINPPLYSPETCIFVTSKENGHHKRVRNDNQLGLTGVYYDKARGKFASTVHNNGKTLFRKRFNTIEEASKYRDDYIIKHDLPHTLNGVLNG